MSRNSKKSGLKSSRKDRHRDRESAKNLGKRRKPVGGKSPWQSQEERDAAYTKAAESRRGERILAPDDVSLRSPTAKIITPRTGGGSRPTPPRATHATTAAPVTPVKPAAGKGGGPKAFLERIGRSSGPGETVENNDRRGSGDRREGRDRRDRSDRGGPWAKPARPGKSDRTERTGRFDRPGKSKKFEQTEEPPGRRGRRKQSFDTGVEVHGEVQKNAKGFAFLLHKPEDIFIPPSFASQLLTGDVVKVVINPRNKEVIDLEITKRIIKSFIGTYQAGFDQRIVQLTDRTMREDVVITERPSMVGLRDGNKVQVEITKYEPFLEGRIVRDFGPLLAPQFDTLAVVVKSQWPQEFSADANHQAEKLSQEVQAEAAAKKYVGRKDHREKPYVTIDGKDSRDFDDAVLVEKTASGYVLYVAIADVSEFVRPGMKLDDEAFARATSVYFPEWVIPMLPEALSNGACSLRPNEEKLVLTCEMHYDFKGKKRSAKVYESVIRSSRRCIYEDVYKEWKDGNAFWTSPFELYQLIRTSRNKRGALDLDLPEAKIVLDENSDTIDIKKVERLDSHRLIEEFMIAANESVTEIMEREGWPFVYRVHEPPQAAALERFERFAMALGLKPNFGEGTDPKLFSKFIDTLKDNPFSTTLYYLMLRSLKQARYDAMNLKHFGLASEAYTHFTSPIRRYPDLMVHRLLKMFVRHEDMNEAQKAEYLDYLVEACDHCSKQERKAESLDRTVIKVKKARFMAKHLGENFDARITNTGENGVFVELLQWFVDGLVPIDELEGDYFEFFEEKMMLKGKRTGKKYRIGDTIRVTVLRTDVDNGFIDFTLAREENDEETEEEQAEG